MRDRGGKGGGRRRAGSEGLREWAGSQAFGRSRGMARVRTDLVKEGEREGGRNNVRGGIEKA